MYFETGSAELLVRSHSLLDEVALIILDHPEIIHVEVQGHTDSVGRAANNLALSRARAQAVQSYLVSAGVSGQRLSAAGKGETEPLIAEESDEARAKNRRVEFHVKSTSSE